MLMSYKCSCTINYQPFTLTNSSVLTVLPGSDNPVYEGAFEFNSIAAGGSIGGAQRLASGSTDIAINWAGGLHHAKKTGASGFCYINDIVLGILELLRTFPRVLYVDVDCHHGDAVEEAFYTSERVLTCSLHKFGDFFPGTGFVEDRGVGKGWRYAMNVPFRTGLKDENLKSVFVPVSTRLASCVRYLVDPLQVNGSHPRAFPTRRSRPPMRCRFTSRGQARTIQYQHGRARRLCAVRCFPV